MMRRHPSHPSHRSLLAPFPQQTRRQGWRPASRQVLSRRAVLPVVSFMTVATIVAACSGGSDEDERDPTAAASAGSRPATVEATWTSRVRAVEPPRAAAGAAVFHSLTSSGTFQVVSLDPRDGKVLWNSAASPSGVAPGVGLRLVLLDDKRVVVWMEPSAVATAGTVSIVAADAATGQRLWAYGDGALRLSSSPEACLDGHAICLTTRRPGITGYLRIVLDGKTGRPLTQTDLTAESSRAVGENLHDDSTGLTAYTDEGEVRWSKPYSVVFPGLNVNADYGWDVELKDGTYVATFGYVPDDPPGRSETATRAPLDATRFGATGAFDAATGESRWVRPDASLFCGVLSFDIDHPVRCVSKGTVTFGGDQPEVSGVDVTLEGFDRQSGKTTWTWHAGEIPGFVVPSEDPSSQDVRRVDDTHYVVRTAGRTALLDLDHGPTPEAAPAAQWCFKDSTADPSFRISGYEQASGYATSGWYPCTDNGATDVPASTPDFAGARIDDIYVWQDENGIVRAGRLH